ncbi:hypothetical protein GCM10009122_44070 [Fulvivirga kasyanovii]
MLIAGNNIPSTEEDTNKEPNNLMFLFNTMVDCSYNIYFNKEPSNWIMPTNVKIDNNIIVTNMGHSSISSEEFVRIDSDYLSSDLDDWGTNKFNKNIFFSGSTISLVTAGYNINSDLLNYIEVDPSIVRSWETYIPRTSSIAIDNATQAGYEFINEDIFQQPRDSSPDIGCYERTSGGPFGRIASGEVTVKSDKHLHEGYVRLQVYPNPTEGVVTLDFQETRVNTHISIQNISGQILYSRYYSEVKKVSLNLDKYSEGVYFVDVANNELNRTVKIFKKE